MQISQTETLKEAAMPRTYSFDPKCYDLAEHFLGKGASEAAKNDLAQDIQNCVELNTQEAET